MSFLKQVYIKLYISICLGKYNKIQVYFMDVYIFIVFWNFKTDRN